MADSSRTTILSRRNAPAAAGAALVLAHSTAPAAKPQAETAEWLTKWNRMIECEVGLCKATDKADGARFAARSEYPKQRLNLPSPGLRVAQGEFVPVWSYGLPMGFVLSGKATGGEREKIEQHYDRYFSDNPKVKRSAAVMAEFRAEGERLMAASLAEYDGWKKACDQVDALHGVPALSIAEEKANALLDQAQDEILNSPTTCFAAVAVKLALGFDPDDRDDHLDDKALRSVLSATTELAQLPPNFWIRPQVDYSDDVPHSVS